MNPKMVNLFQYNTKILYILIIFCFGFKCADKNCVLNNGKYKVVYDKEFADYPKFEFQINGQSLTEINSNVGFPFLGHLKIR